MSMALYRKRARPGVSGGGVAPTITSFSPSSGPVSTVVGVIGTGFVVGATNVSVNGITSPTVTVTSSTGLTFVVPSGATTGAFTINTVNGSATSPTNFTVTVPSGVAPVVSDRSPGSGLVGSSIVVIGQYFTGATIVRLNGTAVPSFTVLSDTRISFVVQAGMTSGVISVTTPDGTGTGTRVWTLTALTTPVITDISPAQAPVGTMIRLFGTSFQSGQTVRFNGTSATVTAVDGTTLATAVVPAGATTGPVTVQTSAGTAAGVTFTVGTMPTGRFSSRTNPTTGVTVAMEHARGVTSTYDVLLDTETHTASGTLWNWAPERIGATRHSAISGANRITVTTTGTTGAADFIAARNTLAALSGDCEIVVPVGTISFSGQYDLSFPAGRRLYVTCASPQTANVMPSLTGNFSVIEGASIQQAYVWQTSGSGNNITFTGIRWKARAEVANSMLLFINDAATVPTDMPSFIVFDRCVIDGNGRNDIRRGLRPEIYCMAWLESQIIDVSLNSECSGINAWDGAAFHYYRNLYVEAAGIGIMYGGAESRSSAFVCHDIMMDTIASAKRAKWMPPDPSWDGVSRTIKNNLECKKVHRWTMRHVAIVNAYDALGQSHSVIWKNGSPLGTVDETTYDVVMVGVDFYRAANGISFLGRGTDEVTMFHGLTIIDLRFRDLGYYASTSTTQPWSYQGAIDGFIFDRWTTLIASGKSVSYGHPFYSSGGESKNVWGANFILRSGAGLAGGPSDFTAVYGTEGFRTGWAQSANSYIGANVFYGPDALFNKSVAYPSSTEYTDAIAAGINATTGALTGDITTRGVGGSAPGANITLLDALVSAMSWAYGR